MIAGLSAGYIIFVAGYWLEGFLGWPKLDMATQGMKYVGWEKPGWWVVEAIGHHVNGILLAFVYAGIVYPCLGAFGLIPGDFFSGFLAGLIYGVILYVLFVNVFIDWVCAIAKQPMPFPTTFLGRWANLTVLLLYGAVLGVMYTVKI